MKAGQIAIVISAHQRMAPIEKCLNGFLRVMEDRRDLIFVDNGSGGELSAWAADEFPGITIVRLEKNSLFCGGYNAGSLMLEIQENGGKFSCKTLFRLSARQFSSEQQTPVLYDGHLYGVRQQDKRLVCLDLEGNESWNSGRDKFGSAPYMIADGLIFALNDDGLLTVAEAAPQGYKPLARAQVIEDGYECWGPMAMAAGRLIVRDIIRMVCLKVSEK